MGSVEYDLFPAWNVREYGHVSAVAISRSLGSQSRRAEEAGLTPNYEMTISSQMRQDLPWPRMATRHGAPALPSADVSARSAPCHHRAGQNVVSWINEVNTICTGEIAEP